jgi:hypothetical protein
VGDSGGYVDKRGIGGFVLILGSFVTLAAEFDGALTRLLTAFCGSGSAITVPNGAMRLSVKWSLIGQSALMTY